MNAQTGAVIIIFLFGFVGMFAIKFHGFAKTSKKLGKIVYKTPTGVKYTDAGKLALYMICVIAGILILDFLGWLNATLFFYLCGVVGIFFGFESYSLLMCFLGGRGLYEYGVRSMTGALLYEDMESYQVFNRKGNKGLSFQYNSKGGMFNSTQILFADYDDRKEIDRISKVNVGGKQKRAASYAPRPNKKKKKSKR